MMMIYCSTYGLRYSYMVSALLVRNSNPPIHYSKQTASVVCFFCCMALVYADIYAERDDYIVVCFLIEYHFKQT